MHEFIKNCAKAPVKFYALAISPLIPSTCRFQPTCSAYMLEAIDRHGALKGLSLGLRRLSKCHPLSKSTGHDPVPDVDRFAD